jgi:hypothetical protein
MKKRLNFKLILTLSTTLFMAGQTSLVMADENTEVNTQAAPAVNTATANYAGEQKQQTENTAKAESRANSKPQSQDAPAVAKRPENKPQNKPTFRARDPYRSGPPPYYRDRDYNSNYRRGSSAPSDYRRGYQRPPRPSWDRPPRKKKKSFFSKDKFSDTWDDMLNAPGDMGEMPGGWTAPSVSMPNPVDVGDEFGDAAKDAPDQMRNVYDDNRDSSRRYDDRRRYDNRRPYYYGR